MLFSIVFGAIALCISAGAFVRIVVKRESLPGFTLLLALALVVAAAVFAVLALEPGAVGGQWPLELLPRMTSS